MLDHFTFPDDSVPNRSRWNSDSKNAFLFASSLPFDGLLSNDCPVLLLTIKPVKLPIENVLFFFRWRPIAFNVKTCKTVHQNVDFFFQWKPNAFNVEAYKTVNQNVIFFLKWKAYASSY